MPGRWRRLHVACQNPAVPRVACFVAGAAALLLAVLPMAYLVGFLANFAVPKGIDSGAPGAAGVALAADLALLLSFAVVHSLLARRGVQRRLAAVVSEPLVRSVFSIVAGLQMIALLALWRPLPEPVWSLASPLARAVVWGIFASAWGLVLWALWAVEPTRLFGLRDAWAAALGRRDPPAELAHRGPYRYLRHPLYAATVVAFFAAPDLSRGRLLLAVVLSAYIVVGLRFEERDLARRLGERYLAYRRAVPAFLPRLRR